jgi:hypothetical protein
MMFRGDEFDGVEVLLLAMVDNDVDESAADAALLVFAIDGHSTQPSDGA